MARNDGKYLQNKLQEALKGFVRVSPAYQHRFYDTLSAGNYLPGQPGDFMLLVPEGCALIECKSTITGETVIQMAHRKDKVCKNQLAKHRLWRRTGHPSLYLHLDRCTKVSQWHDGLAVFKKELCPFWEGPVDTLRDSLTLLRLFVKNSRQVSDKNNNII